MSKRTIIVEGPSDEAFVKALVRERGFGQVTVTDTRTEKDRFGGNSKFGTKLRSLKFDDRKEQTRHFLIISDSDGDPAISFNLIRDQVNSVYPGCAPTAPRTNSGTTPSFSIVLIPFDEPGCLETVCSAAVRTARRKLRGDLDLFAASLRYDHWKSEVRKSKFWLRCAIAALHEKDPSIYLRNVFTDPKLDSIIPLKSKSFDGIAESIRSFCDLP